MKRIFLAIIVMAVITLSGWGICNSHKVAKLKEKQVQSGPRCIPGQPCPLSPTKPPQS